MPTEIDGETKNKWIDQKATIGKVKAGRYLNGAHRGRSTDSPVGAHVRISGLISRPELNGEQGVVLFFDHQKARYSVRLADGTEMLLKLECLTLIVPTQAKHE